MASGEIRLSTMTMRQMPVLAQSQDSAQSQGSALNDPNFFSVQQALNGPVFADNTQLLQNTGATAALNSNYFSVAAIADVMSDVTGALSTAASFAESLGSEFAHNFGIAGTAFGTITDITSAANGGISPGHAALNLGVGVATVLGGPLTVFPGAQYFIFNALPDQYRADVGASLSNIAENGLGP